VTQSEREYSRPRRADFIVWASASAMPSVLFFLAAEELIPALPSILPVAFAAVIMGAMVVKIGTLDRAARRAHDDRRLCKLDLTKVCEEIDTLRLDFGNSEERCRHAEARTRLAEQEMASARRTQDDFLMFIERRLTSPLTCAVDFGSRLAHPGLSEAAQAEARRNLGRTSEDVSDALNDLLDLNRIMRGKLEVERRSCSLENMLARVRDALEHRASARGISFRVRCRGEVPERIDADRDRVRRMLKNITARAIRLTEAGEVEVLVEPLEIPGRPTHVQFTVRDTSRGVLPADVDRDYRLPGVTGGEGSQVSSPGLAVVKHIVTSLGGVFHIDSVINRGTTVVFSLPAAAAIPEPKRRRTNAEPKVTPRMGFLPDAAPLEPETEKGTELEGHHVLIAEDGKDNQRLLDFLLKRSGAKFTIVDNGKLAVSAALTAQRSGHPFDYILMDVQMPVMDGNQATRKLREEGYTGAIIALTAHALPRDREECIASGCDEFITKPIDKSSFIKTLQSVHRERCAPVVQLEEQPSLLRQADASTEAREVMNRDPVYSQLSDDEDMRELVEWFVADIGKDAVRIERALEEGDYDRLAVLAHQLKGSAGSYGFPQVTQLAGHLEQSVLGGKPSAEIASAVQSFVDLCTRVRVS